MRDPLLLFVGPQPLPHPRVDLGRTSPLLPSLTRSDPSLWSSMTSPRGDSGRGQAGTGLGQDWGGEGMLLSRASSLQPRNPSRVLGTLPHGCAVCVAPGSSPCHLLQLAALQTPRPPERQAADLEEDEGVQRSNRLLRLLVPVSAPRHPGVKK